MNRGVLLILTVLGLVSGNSYQDGKDDGAAEALAIWLGYEIDCANALDTDECICLSAWNFEEDVQEMIDSYSSPGGGAYQRAHKRGFRVGASGVVDEKEDECFDDPDVCQGLGDLAASIIGKSCTHYQEFMFGSIEQLVN